jgi:hypothetical protein
MSILANAKHEAVAVAYIADPARIGWRAHRKVYAQTSHRAAVTGFTRLLTNADFSAPGAELAEAAAQSAVMAAHEVAADMQHCVVSAFALMRWQRGRRFGRGPRPARSLLHRGPCVI